MANNSFADFDAFANRDYKTANNHLRREWAYWRKTAKPYGFGRTELMPIKGSAEALGQYVGKYIGKRPDYKKAIVTLQEGETIEFFEGA